MGPQGIEIFFTEVWGSVTDSMNSYKAKEAALYVVKQVLDEIGSYDGTIAPEVANAYLDFARIAMQDSRLLSWPSINLPISGIRANCFRRK